MLQTINTESLQPGMYVVRIIKQTGNLEITVGGRIKSADTIDNIKHKGVLEVEIDLEKSTHLETLPEFFEDDYLSATGLTYNQQLESTLELHEQAKSIHRRLLKRVAKGKIADIDEVNTITEKLINTAFECDHALHLVTLLNENDDYFLEHGINCALLIVIFGHALGLDKSTLHHLGVGAMLMDIGMVKLPLLLTQKPANLSPDETTKMQRHVDISLKLIEDINGIDAVSLEVVKQHHERIDGSGYPDGLRDNQISVHGKMAAIVDIYDSLNTHRPYREGLKPAVALAELQKAEFGLDQSLVSQFIACMGAHPVGSIVQLTSGKIGMVTRLNKHQILAPVIMVFYDLLSKQEQASRLDLSQSEEEIMTSVCLEDFKIGMPKLLSKIVSN